MEVLVDPVGRLYFESLSRVAMLHSSAFVLMPQAGIVTWIDVLDVPTCGSAVEKVLSSVTVSARSALSFLFGIILGVMSMTTHSGRCWSSITAVLRIPAPVVSWSYTLGSLELANIFRDPVGWFVV